MGSDIETDITMENDRPDASESESDASVEVLVVIPAPLVAKPPRTGCYLENKDRRLVFVTSTQDLCLFGSSMQGSNDSSTHQRKNYIRWSSQDCGFSYNESIELASWNY